MKTIIQGIVEKRANVWEHMKELLDTAETEKRELTGEEQASFDAMNAELDELDKRRDELEALEVRNRAADEARARIEKFGRPPEVDDDELRKGAHVDELRRFLRGESRSFELDLTGASRELRVGHDGRLEQRTLTVGTAAAGGDTVPTSFERELYRHLVESSAIRQTNVRVLTTSSGENLELPKTVSHGTATIKGEGTAIAGTDPSFGKVTLGAWKYGEMVQVSHELVEDNAIDLLSFVAETAGRAVGEASGADFVTGNGTNKPNGVMTACGTGVTGATSVGGSATADNLIDLVYSVNSRYRRNGFWLMADATAGALRKLKDGNNQYLWAPGLVAGTPDTLLGRPVVTDPNVAAIGTTNKSIAFGDFRGYTIRDVKGVRFERSDDFAFDTDLITFKAVLRTDGDLVDLSGAIKAFKGGAT
jgi:HK97 family phage major capsid protein